MQTQRVAVADGVDLAVDTWSAAPGPAGSGMRPAPAAFVLVHGLASNARMWDGVAARLVARGHPAATLDLRGHGRSAKPDGPYDMATVADDVARVIEALGWERPVVAGQSWGGNVVLELGLRHPDAVRGVACVDGGWLEPRATFDSWEACRDRLAPPQLAGLHRDDIERFIRGAHADWPETGIAGTLANFEVRDDGTVAPWLTFDRHIAILAGLWDHRPSEIYATIRPSVLLVPAETSADERAMQKRQGVDAAMAALQNARLRWIHGDHDIHAQHPDELADVMIDLVGEGFFA